MITIDTSIFLEELRTITAEYHEIDQRVLELLEASLEAQKQTAELLTYIVKFLKNEKMEITK